MRPSEVEILDPDLDDDIPVLRGPELGLPIDLTRPDLEDEDDVGFRTLYEFPEAVIRRSRWPYAA